MASVVSGRVSAIVPSYERQDALPRCITSLAASEPLPPRGLEIIIVSSGYKQELFDELRDAARPGVTVDFVVLATKEFVSRSRNLGADYASGEVLLFIDDDNEVAPDTVERLRVALSVWQDAAMVAPVMYYRAEPTRIWCAGANRTAVLARTRMRTELPSPVPERLTSVDFPNCFMVRASEFRAIGGFDDRAFPQVYEEADLAARLLSHRDGTCFCVTAAATWHEIDPTGYRRYHLTSTASAYGYGLNRQLYIRRHGSLLQRAADRVIGRWLFLGAYLFAMRTAPSGTRRSLATAYLRGFLAGRRVEPSLLHGAHGENCKKRDDGVQATSRPPTITMAARCPIDRPGGVERVVREVSAGLVFVRPSWEVRIVTAFRRPSLASRIPLVGDVVAATRFGLAALKDWDVFLVNGSEYAWGPLLVGRLRRRPVVVVWHGVRWGEAQGYVPAGRATALAYRTFFALERWIQHLALTADATVAVSPKVADELRSIYGFADTIHVIPNGVTPPAHPTESGARQDFPSHRGSVGSNQPLRVLWVGAHKQWFPKGLDVALEACALARQAGTDLMLDVVGCGEAPREFAAYGELNWITWHGRLLPEQMAERYVHADVLLLPTRYEGFSMVALEALASGLPVVGSSASAGPVAAAGIIVEDWEPSAYAAALTALWRSSTLWATLAEKAVVRASQFTWEAASTSYAEVIEAFADGAKHDTRRWRPSTPRRHPPEAQDRE